MKTHAATGPVEPATRSSASSATVTVLLGAHSSPNSPNSRRGRPCHSENIHHTALRATARCSVRAWDGACRSALRCAACWATACAGSHCACPTGRIRTHKDRFARVRASLERGRAIGVCACAPMRVPARACVCVCVCAHSAMCMRACVHACMHACVRVRVCEAGGGETASGSSVVIVLIAASENRRAAVSTCAAANG
jgi:hypothetical protein